MSAKSPQLIVSYDNAIERLANTLDGIAAVTPKTMAFLLADTTTQITIGGNGVKGLFQEFRDIRPNADKDIRSAPWGIGRTRRVFGEYGRMGLSLTAERRAEALLGGRKSGLFRLSGGGVLKKPIPLVESPAVGKRKARNVLFRSGVNAKPAYATVKRSPDEKRLNLRALAIYYELQLRSTGIGFSAAEFAIRRAVLGLNLRTAADRNASARIRTLRTNGGTIGSIDYNPTGVVIRGDLDLRSDVTGIEVRVIRRVLADKEAYLARKVVELFPQKI